MCIALYMCITIYAYILFVCVYIYIYIHTHSHTYTYTYILLYSCRRHEHVLHEEGVVGARRDDAHLGD